MTIDEYVRDRMLWELKLELDGLIFEGKSGRAKEWRALVNEAKSKHPNFIDYMMSIKNDTFLAIHCTEENNDNN